MVLALLSRINSRVCRVFKSYNPIFSSAAQPQVQVEYRGESQKGYVEAKTFLQNGHAVEKTLSQNVLCQSLF